jgi:hypothetical protein
MKKVIFLLAAFAVLSSCSKKEEQTPKFKEEGGKIQYPVGYMKEKIDNVDNPKIYATNIFVDLSENSKSKISERKKSVVLFNGEYITSIHFRWSVNPWNTLAFDGWGPIPGIPDPDHQDLNQGAGGRYIYFLYNTQYQYQYYGYGPPSYDPAPITDFWVTTMESSSDEYTCHNQHDNDADLNYGAGGLYVYAHAKKGGSNRQLIGVGTIVGNSSTIQAPYGWEKINVDLNRGAGGPYIFFIVIWKYL